MTDMYEPDTTSDTTATKQVATSDTNFSGATSGSVSTQTDGSPTGVPPHHRRTQPLTAAFLGLIILALSFGGGWLGAASHDDQSNSITQQKTVLSDQAAVVSSIAKTVGASVVSVDVTGEAASGFSSFFGAQGGTQTQQSAGTGIILSSDGLIMTNRHVVPSGTTKVSVTLSDGTVFDNVKVVGRTSENDSLDVAFLKVQDTKGKSLAAAKLGDSSKVKVGDSVVAIGNALGQFQNTVTSGIISGYGRSVQASDGTGNSSENLDDLFQTDAAINEGNSGGPLVNLNGEVIGMNTALASGSQNIGFAIPLNNVAGLIDSIKTTGKLQRPYLGIVYVPLTSDVAKQYSLGTDRGAYIPNSSDLGQVTVIADGPAAKAGVKEGDIITKVSGVTIDQNTSLTSALGKHKVNDKVTLTIIRDSKTVTLDATIGSAPTG